MAESVSYNPAQVYDPVHVKPSKLGNAVQPLSNYTLLPNYRFGKARGEVYEKIGGPVFGVAHSE